MHVYIYVLSLRKEVGYLLKGYLHKGIFFKGIFKVNLDMTDSSPSIVWVIEDIVLLERMPGTWGQSEGQRRGEREREGWGGGRGREIEEERGGG